MPHSMPQHGLSMQHRGQWDLVLAPMAARAIKNLSWKGSRTLRTPAVEVPATYGNWDFLLESGAWHESWQPL